MLKATASTWENTPLNIQHGIVEDMLLLSEKHKKLGLQMLDVLVMHEFFYSDPDYEQLSSRLKHRLITFLKQEDKRELTRLTASLCGLILAKDAQKDRKDAAFEDGVSALLSDLHYKNKFDVFVDILYNITYRYQPLLARFASSNLSLLNSLYGTLKVKKKYSSTDQSLNLKKLKKLKKLSSF